MTRRTRFELAKAKERAHILEGLKIALDHLDEVIHTIRNSANAEIVLEEVHDVLTLPESAIQYEGEQTFVYVKNGLEYERREVETGLSDGVNIEIKRGLALDDVVRGPQIITTK